MFVLKSDPATWVHRQPVLYSFGLLGMLLLLCACAAVEPAENKRLEEVSGKSQPKPEVTGTGDAWAALLERDAYPFYTPLPPDVATLIDGIYVKFDPKKSTPIPCRRCPDYMNEGGLWKLSFDKGTFRIMHLVTGWTGIGSYTVLGDRLLLFNDPKCPREVGRYKWRFEAEGLSLDAMADLCAASMRSHNLAQMPWQRCPPALETVKTSGQEGLTAGC